MNKSKLFTERQDVKVLSKFAKSLNEEDNRRCEEDFEFVKARHQLNEFQADIQVYYRIGFALAVEWTRDNLTAKPRREKWNGSPDGAMYEPERSAFLMNLPSDEWQLQERPVLMSDVPLAPVKHVREMPGTEQLIRWQEKVTARRIGYSAGWQDGNWYVRYQNNLPTVTTREEREEISRIAGRREIYANWKSRVARTAALQEFDDLVAQGIDPFANFTEYQDYLKQKEDESRAFREDLIKTQKRREAERKAEREEAARQAKRLSKQEAALLDFAQKLYSENTND